MFGSNVLLDYNRTVRSLIKVKWTPPYTPPAASEVQGICLPTPLPEKWRRILPPCLHKTRLTHGLWAQHRGGESEETVSKTHIQGRHRLICFLCGIYTKHYPASPVIPIYLKHNHRYSPSHFLVSESTCPEDTAVHPSPHCGSESAGDASWETGESEPLFASTPEGLLDYHHVVSLSFTIKTLVEETF